MSNNLDANWLSRQMEEISSDYAMAFSPDAPTVAQMSGATRTPLDPEDAGKLRAKLAKRYREWTGRDLATDMQLTSG